LGIDSNSALSGSDDCDGSEDMYIRIGLGANFLRIQEITPRPRRGTGSNVGQKGLERCQFAETSEDLYSQLVYAD